VGLLADAILFRNAGTGTFTTQRLLGTVLPRPPRAGDVDGDGDLELLSVTWYPTVVEVHHNLGGAIFAPPVSHPIGEPDVIAMDVLLGDLDGDADQDLVAYGYYARAISVLRNPGNGAFEPYEPWNSGATYQVAAADLDGDGDRDLAFTPLAMDTVEVLRNCVTSSVTSCAGDGSGLPCPCGNDSPPGSGAGCRSSLGNGAVLAASGSARLHHDELRLRASGMPNGLAVYVQGTLSENNGAGTPFADGLVCVGGTLVRLAARVNAGGASEVPAAGEAPLHVRGHVAQAGERFYQVWYRNAAAFCTPGTFNLTNGVRVLWAN
jgi:hypothetical protein